MLRLVDWDRTEWATRIVLVLVVDVGEDVDERVPGFADRFIGSVSCVGVRAAFRSRGPPQGLWEALQLPVDELECMDDEHEDVPERVQPRHGDRSDRQGRVVHALRLRRRYLVLQPQGAGDELHGARIAFARRSA